MQSGTVNLNMDNNNRTALNNDLVINGNVSLTSGSMVNTENHKESIVNIGLATNKSSLNGVIANGFSEKTLLMDLQVLLIYILAMVQLGIMNYMENSQVIGVVETSQVVN